MANTNAGATKAPKYPSSIIHSKHMQYGPVCPLPVARRMKEEGILGNYHLLLAHDVVKDPKGYAEVYMDPNNFIIMDNSAAELKAPVDYEMLLEAGLAVDADCLVLPDFLLDGPATIGGHVEGYEKLEHLWPNDFMALPQGDSIGVWHWCANVLLEIMPKRVRYWGIPRNFQEKLRTSRQVAVMMMSMIDTNPNHKFHLFGFSDSLWDDLCSARLKYSTEPRLMGIDSAVPVRMGYNGVGLHPLQNDPGPRGNWWDEPGEYNPLVKQNMDNIRKWIARNGGAV